MFLLLCIGSNKVDSGFLIHAYLTWTKDCLTVLVYFYVTGFTTILGAEIEVRAAPLLQICTSPYIYELCVMWIYVCTVKALSCKNKTPLVTFPRGVSFKISFNWVNESMNQTMHIHACMHGLMDGRKEGWMKIRISHKRIHTSKNTHIHAHTRMYVMMCWKVN